jgi:hypothetical protein
MNATLIAESEELRRTAERLQRAGLVVERSIFSPARRRAYFALQCQLVRELEPAAPRQPPIGFAYPTPRGAEPLA